MAGSIFMHQIKVTDSHKHFRDNLSFLCLQNQSIFLTCLSRLGFGVPGVYLGTLSGKGGVQPGRFPSPAEVHTDTQPQPTI